MALRPWAGSGTATGTPATVDVRAPADFSPLGRISAGALALQNTGATNALLVSFDGGTNFLTVVAGASLSVNRILVDSVTVKAGAATTTYEWVARDSEEN